MYFVATRGHSCLHNCLRLLSANCSKGQTSQFTFAKKSFCWHIFFLMFASMKGENHETAWELFINKSDSNLGKQFSNEFQRLGLEATWHAWTSKLILLIKLHLAKGVFLEYKHSSMTEKHTLEAELTCMTVKANNFCNLFNEAWKQTVCVYKCPLFCAPAAATKGCNFL